MTLNIARETDALGRLSITELRQRFAALFGEPTRTDNRTWLIKRLVWRLQVLQEGDLSERGRQRIAELGNDADLRLLPPRPPKAADNLTLDLFFVRKGIRLRSIRVCPGPAAYSSAVTRAPPSACKSWNGASSTRTPSIPP